MPQVEEQRQRPRFTWEFRFFTTFMVLFLFINLGLDMLLQVTDVFRMMVVTVMVYMATIRLVGFH